MNKEIAWTAVAQIIALIVGFLALGIVLKLCGWPDDAGHTIRWTPLANGLRANGLWLFVLILLWVVYAIVSEALERGVFSPAWAAGSGILVAVVIFVLFFTAAFLPYTRPMLLPTSTM